MKIPKLFKKAAAFVMAAVTALSIMPATAFAAGDIGTIEPIGKTDSLKGCIEGPFGHRFICQGREDFIRYPVSADEIVHLDRSAVYGYSEEQYFKAV